ncbi:hypothetical protein [Marinicellulosiphila megalodicopiae]|uniref:hypothetical protein n=1 Tax=Marinicellulosiphila megalodicopiae TaxID=2724896 RepID=UPI003BAEF639
MYTDEDLNQAIQKGIFTASAVDEFRHTVSDSKYTISADEENFNMIGGFNDIFVVIACCLLLFSSLFVLIPITGFFGLIIFVATSWWLAEIFVLKRKMALPAILLLFAFVGGVFSFVISMSSDLSHPSLFSIILATSASMIAAFFHWKRFKVPITIAAGTVALIALIVSIFISIFPNEEKWILTILSICGIATFFLAMYWDASDTKRITNKSDVAFWCHLIAAPLFIHPAFTSLGVMDGNENMLNMLGVVILYLIMTTLSIAIDRRAFMVSSLAYVLYALTTILKNYGDVGYSFALTGLFMGAMLLLLSVFWQTTRSFIVKKLPIKIRKLLPAVN